MTTRETQGLTPGGLAPFPPVNSSKPVPLNDIHTRPLDKVQAEPTPRKA